MLPFEFEIKINTKDLYRFKMYQAYHSMQGLMSLVFFVMLIFVAFSTEGKIGLLYSSLYLLSAILVLIYFPLIMYLQARNVIKKTDTYKYPMEYFLSNDGLRIRAIKPLEDENEKQKKIEFIAWNKVYRVKETRTDFYIFSGQDEAYLLPKHEINVKLSDLRDFFRDRLPKEKVKVNK